MLRGIGINDGVHSLSVFEPLSKRAQLRFDSRLFGIGHRGGFAVLVCGVQINAYGAERNIILVIIFFYIRLGNRLFAALVLDKIEKPVSVGVGGLDFHERLL